MLEQAIKKIVLREHLTLEEAKITMDEIMLGQCKPSQIAAFLIGLRMKGESIDEIIGCVYSMKENAKNFSLEVERNSKNVLFPIDTCGTGGDESNTFNISTTAAIIAAAAGIKVAKHGNKAVSSKSGSADVLDALGVKIDLESCYLEQCLQQTNMAFLFAQKYHPAMKNVAEIRKELGTRTIFNLLGPLMNPADIKGQVLGVYDKNITHLLGEVLLKLGRERALVVHGNDGMDEITITTKTTVTEVKNGKVYDYTIDPLEYGIPLCTKQEIQGGDAKENATIILEILKGKKGPKRDIVVLNAAAALYVGNAVEDFQEGILLAQELIDSQKAYHKLQQIIQFCKGEVA
ncbi:anthranilate phosphoribosyltransferase [Garciella nitratireducens]|uniref:anthranilate phosphoribosyltransferase n=1 Tax=Garciella nitratireducens TaxID=218205 RepID=UPI001BD63BE3|nr:anthranilate phosphoribosyltransferase [Garciella nitratireducens]